METTKKHHRCSIQSWNFNFWIKYLDLMSTLSAMHRF